jgi:hypothetical protein
MRGGEQGALQFTALTFTGLSSQSRLTSTLIYIAPCCLCAIVIKVFLWCIYAKG